MLEILVPDNKLRLVKSFLKEHGIHVKIKKGDKIPNIDTMAAMNELKAGKGKRFINVDELFKSIWLYLTNEANSEYFTSCLNL